jgi:hypothetical protein
MPPLTIVNRATRRLMPLSRRIRLHALPLNTNTFERTTIPPKKQWTVVTDDTNHHNKLQRESDLGAHSHNIFNNQQ